MRTATVRATNLKHRVAPMRRPVTMTQTRRMTTAHAWRWTSAVYAEVTALLRVNATAMVMCLMSVAYAAVTALPRVNAIAMATW